MWQVSPGALGPTILSTDTILAVYGSLGLYKFKGGSFACSSSGGKLTTLDSMLNNFLETPKTGVEDGSLRRNLSPEKMEEHRSWLHGWLTCT